MAAYDFNSLVVHAGHEVVVSTYVEGDVVANVAVECLDCGEVILDFDNPDRVDQSENGDIRRFLEIASLALGSDEFRSDIGMTLNLSDREIERLRRKVSRSLEALDVAQG